MFLGYEKYFECWIALCDTLLILFPNPGRFFICWISTNPYELPKNYCIGQFTFFHSFIKIYFVGIFFLFSVLASLWCFCISFTTTTWQLTKVKKEGGDTSSFFQTDSYFLCEFEQISLLLHVCFHICTAGVNFPWAL